MLKIGDRVKLLPSCRYIDFIANPHWGGSHGKVIGTITQNYGCHYEVKWDNGHTNNCYEEGRDLAIVKEKNMEEEKKVKKEDDEKIPCEGCDELYDDEDLRIGADDCKYCESCFENNFFICDDCGEVCNNDYRTVTNTDRHICKECYENNYFYCEGCDEVIHSNYYGGDGYCENCYEDDDDEHDHTSVHLTKYCDINRDFSKLKQLAVSVEIEGEKGNYNSAKYDIEKLDYGCGVCTDGSLDDETGIEIQTTPCKITKFSEIIPKICKVMRGNDYQATARCGLHTHIGLNGSTDEQIMGILKTFACVEDVLYTVLPPSRSSTHYCHRLPDVLQYKKIRKKRELNKLMRLFYACGSESYAEDLPRSFQGIKNMYKHVKYHDSRYHGFNLHSFILRNTIELRYHSGTINPYKIIMWVKFMLNITNWARLNYSMKCLDYIYSIKDPLKKLTAVLDLVTDDKSHKKYFIGRYNNFLKEREKEEKEREKRQEEMRVRLEEMEGQEISPVFVDVEGHGYNRQI